MKALSTATTISLPESSDGREVKLCGIITTVKSMLTKKGDKMAYLTLEDLLGVVEIIIFPDLYKNAADLIVVERLVRITGTVDRGDKGTKVRGSKIEPLADVQAQAIKRVHIRLIDHPDVAEQLPRLREIFQRHPGNTTISLTLRMDASQEAVTAPLPNLTITPSERFVADVEEVLGKGAIFLLS